MFVDLVVDTNVLVHANNEAEDRQLSSLEFINYLLDSTELICIDEGFDMDEGQNRSYIGHEYLKHLRNGDPGYTLIVRLAQSKRISEISRTTSAQTTKKINQCLANNHDRVFIKVATNSTSKILLSHDFADFSVDKRTHIRKTFGVKVIEASEFLEIIKEQQ